MTGTGAQSRIGGIAATAIDCRITNCVNLCTVTQTGSSIEGTGGIAGFLVFQNGYKQSEILLISDCYNLGTVTGYDIGGGIAGYISCPFGLELISNCYNAGQITGTLTDEITASGSNYFSNCNYLSDTDKAPAARTAEEFADSTVLKLLINDRDDSEHPWAADCEYLAAAGRTLPVFKGQGDEHTHQSDKWECNETEHWKDCSCAAVFDKEVHSGEATCAEKAKCEVCGYEYGDIDPANHADLKKVPAKAATKTEEGNIEHWHCEGCGKYYANEGAEKELTKEEITLAKLPSSPKTGDSSSVMLWSALMIACASICLATTAKKRKNNR